MVTKKRPIVRKRRKTSMLSLAQRVERLEHSLTMLVAMSFYTRKLEFMTPATGQAPKARKHGKR